MSFLLAVAGKLLPRGAFAEFRRSTAALVPVPRRWGGPLAAAVVGAECLVILLIFTEAGFLLALLLLTGFTAVIVRTVRRGSRTACRCFGGSDQPLSRRHVARNLILAGAAAGGLAATGAPVDVAAAPGVLLGLALAGVIARFDDLIDLFAASTPTRL